MAARRDRVHLSGRQEPIPVPKPAARQVATTRAACPAAVAIPVPTAVVTPVLTVVGTPVLTVVGTPAVMT